MMRHIFDHLRGTKRTKRDKMIFQSTVGLVEGLLAWKPEMPATELLECLSYGRKTMLSIALMLRFNTHPDRMLHTDADDFWEKKGRDDFVNEAAVWLTKPAIRALYDEVQRNEKEPLRMFLARLDHDIKDNMGIFLYEQIAKAKRTAKSAAAFVKRAEA